SVPKLCEHAKDPAEAKPDCVPADPDSIALSKKECQNLGGNFRLLSDSEYLALTGQPQYYWAPAFGGLGGGLTLASHGPGLTGQCRPYRATNADVASATPPDVAVDSPHPTTPVKPPPPDVAVDSPHPAPPSQPQPQPPSHPAGSAGPAPAPPATWSGPQINVYIPPAPQPGPVHTPPVEPPPVHPQPQHPGPGPSVNGGTPPAEPTPPHPAPTPPHPGPTAATPNPTPQPQPLPPPQKGPRENGGSCDITPT